MKYKYRSEISFLLEDIYLGDKSDYYRFGWEYFGPFLYGFTSWLRREIEARKINKIYFFSRDGYMMKKAFDVMDVGNHKTDYVYFSRKSIRQAFLWRCETYKKSLKYLTWEKYISLGKILEYYGFSEKERQVLAKTNNWVLTKEYEYDSLEQCSELEKVYEQIKSIIQSMSKAQDELLFNYLKQISLAGECAIVDIGWRGSMQFYLEQYLNYCGIDALLHGFYVGIYPDYSFNGTVHGFLYNAKRTQLRKSTLCFFGVYEKLFQSAEGSTYGYAKEEEKVVPILNTYEYKNDKQVISCISDWQKAALEFVMKGAGITLDTSEELALAMPLVNLGKNPTLKEVHLFKFLYNTDGIKEFYVSQKSLFHYKPIELVHAINNSVWKTGFMKSVFKLPFPYYRIYSMLKH